MNWRHILVLAMAGAFVCSCGGDAPPLAEPIDPHVQGDCGFNNWVFEPFREVVVAGEMDSLAYTDLVAYQNEIKTKSYLEVLVRDTGDGEFPVGTAIDLSDQMNDFDDFDMCEACVVFRHQCRADASGVENCHKIFVAIAGTLKITERGDAEGEAFNGRIYDLVLQEDVNYSVDPGAVGAKICMLEYVFNTSIAEVLE